MSASSRLLRFASSASRRARKVAPPRPDHNKERRATDKQAEVRRNAPTTFRPNELVSEQKQMASNATTNSDEIRDPNVMFQSTQTDGDRTRGLLFLAAGVTQFVFSLSMADLARRLWGRKDKETGERKVAGPWERNLVALSITGISAGLLVAVVLTPMRIVRFIKFESSKREITIGNSLPFQRVFGLIGLRSQRRIPIEHGKTIANMRGDPRISTISGGQTKYVILKFGNDRFGYLVDRTGWFKNRSSFADMVHARKI